MEIKAFFDKITSTLTYVVYNSATRDAVIIDPVLDYDPGSGRITRTSVDEVIKFVNESKFKVHAILETHAHADHLSSSQILKIEYPHSEITIGERIKLVQEIFRPIYNFSQELPPGGSQFDRLLRDQERVKFGELAFNVHFTPGHTQACATYDFDGHAFVGDALFMPDYGTGRTDFPGGSAEDLFDSVKGRIYKLPESTRLFTGHDYQPGGRPLKYESTVGEQLKSNVQLNSGTTREEFLKFRNDRDKTLAAPRLLHPSIQVNINAGKIPDMESNGRAYLKTPVTISF